MSTLSRCSGETPRTVIDTDRSLAAVVDELERIAAAAQGGVEPPR